MTFIRMNSKGNLTMATLSVCMIVKDEEQVIDRVLTCAKQFADEIIVVDTGSTDNTISLAKKYTDKIYNYKWNNNFASARNYSFRLASCDYIMWLDADDYITQENTYKILNLKNKLKDTQFVMCKYSMMESDERTITFYRERIIENNKDFKWEGFVHECITPSGNIIYSDTEIEHRKVKHSNPKRNLKLYNLALKSGATFSPREQYYYSRELYYNGYYSKAIKEIKHYLQLNDKYYPNTIGAYLLISEMYLHKRNIDNAKKYILTSISKYTPTAEVCCLCARIFEADGNPSSSIFWYTSALITTPQSEGFVRQDFQDFIPLLELSRLLYSTNYKQAKEYFMRARNLKPNHQTILYNSQFFIK